MMCLSIVRPLPSGLGESKETSSADAAEQIVTVLIARVCHDPSISPSLCRAYMGPCSATKDEINTLFSLSLSAAGGEANEETLGCLTTGWSTLIRTRI